MIIKSDFHDCYDPFAKYDDDYATRFIRKSSEPILVPSPCKSPNLTQIEYKGEKGWTGLHIGLCGKFYPVLITKFRFGSKPIVCNYDPESIKKNDWNSWNPTYTEFVEFFDKNKEFGEKLTQDYGPVFGVWFHRPDPWVQMNWEELKKRAFDKYARFDILVQPNLCLDTYGFYKIMAPHLIYHEIYKFICNKGNPAKPIPEMSNDVKIHQAGFDLKQSFRKRKN